MMVGPARPLRGGGAGPASVRGWLAPDGAWAAASIRVDPTSRRMRSAVIREQPSGLQSSPPAALDCALSPPLACGVACSAGRASTRPPCIRPNPPPSAGRDKPSGKRDLSARALTPGLPSVSGQVCSRGDPRIPAVSGTVSSDHPGRPCGSKQPESARSCGRLDWCQSCHSTSAARVACAGRFQKERPPSAPGNGPAACVGLGLGIRHRGISSQTKGLVRA